MQGAKYLNDSYINKFKAKFDSITEENSQWKVTLEETWFYPESGGQPADHGTLGGANVIDVQQVDGKVVHTLDAEPESEDTVAKVDWKRRYDHMQQHTAQHLLTAAIVNLFNAPTLSFHLGSETSTIDIELDNLSLSDISDVEDLCSQWISLDFPIEIKFYNQQEFAELELRKKALPDHIDGDIRLINIGDIDASHCGGTHLRSTAEVQIIKIIATEKIRETLRVHFLAGQRAIDDYRFKDNLLRDLSDIFTTGPTDLKNAVEKLKSEQKNLISENKKLAIELANFKADAQAKLIRKSGNINILVSDFGLLDMQSLKNVAGKLTKADTHLHFAGISEDNGRLNLIMASGSESKTDLGVEIRKLLTTIDGKGGGRGNFAQATGETTNKTELIESAWKLLEGLGELS